MTNVVIIDFEGSTYTDAHGVRNRYNQATIENVDGKWFLFAPHAFPIEFKSRKDLAEFLWMAVRLVDSEARWEKDKYVGLNYE